METGASSFCANNSKNFSEKKTFLVVFEMAHLIETEKIDPKEEISCLKRAKDIYRKKI